MIYTNMLKPTTTFLSGDAMSTHYTTTLSIHAIIKTGALPERVL